MPVVRWIRCLALAGVLLCFTVVVLGAYVRLTAAGLGCPDWPGCYGHITPLGAQESAAAQAAFPLKPLDVGKAWREMIHRYAATTLGVVILVLAALSIATHHSRLVSTPYALALLAIVIFQGLLGMLTVTWQLKPLIVTAHLVFGLTTLGLLWWLWLSLPAGPRRTMPKNTVAPAIAGAAVTPGPVAMAATPGPVVVAAPPGTSSVAAETLARRCAWRLALAGLIALSLQIVLGGWTSSNYAAIACPDFPTCQNAWWPHADFRDAFVLWRGLAVNFEGGVLDNPTRVAIHLTHRLGALIATLTLCWAALTAMLRPAAANMTLCGAAVLGALALQLTIGISMVLEGFPLSLATAHTAGAALLVLAVLALLRTLRVRAHVQSF